MMIFTHLSPPIYIIITFAHTRAGEEFDYETLRDLI